MLFDTSRNRLYVCCCLANRLSAQEHVRHAQKPPIRCGLVYRFKLPPSHPWRGGFACLDPPAALPEEGFLAPQASLLQVHDDALSVADDASHRALRRSGQAGGRAASQAYIYIYIYIYIYSYVFILCDLILCYIILYYIVI